MREAARRAVAAQAETLIVVSPHSPRVPESLGIWNGERLHGSLKVFGHPNLAVGFPADGILADEIATGCARRGLRTVAISDSSLDHGATVPLWFIAEAGWRGPIVVLGLSSLGPDALMAIGEAIAEAAEFVGRHVALIASGDMSHRLTPDALFGFDARGPEFDRWFIHTLQRGEYWELLKPDPEIEKAAMQDTLDSVLVALGAVGFSATGADVLNYEGPFGVGYGVAILYLDGMIPPQS